MKRMKHRQAWSYYEGVLANAEVAEQGHVACIDTASGEIVVSQEAATLLPIGYFDQSLTGNGTAKVRVQLFNEIWVDRLANDTVAAVAAADVGSVCYLLDSQTVTSDATGNSVAGRVWDVRPEGVFVQMAISMGIQGIQGAPGV